MPVSKPLNQPPGFLCHPRLCRLSKMPQDSFQFHRLENFRQAAGHYPIHIRGTSWKRGNILPMLSHLFGCRRANRKRTSSPAQFLCCLSAEEMLLCLSADLPGKQRQGTRIPIPLVLLSHWVVAKALQNHTAKSEVLPPPAFFHNCPFYHLLYAKRLGGSYPPSLKCRDIT